MADLEHCFFLCMKAIANICPLHVHSKLTSSSFTFIETKDSAVEINGGLKKSAISGLSSQISSFYKLH